MRRPPVLLAVALVLLAGAGGLGLAFAGRHGPSGLDSWFYTRLAAPAGAVPLARTLLLLVTNPVLVYGVACAFALFCVRNRRPAAAVVAACTPVLAVVCSSVLLKPLFERWYGGFLCYPSGHTTLLVATLSAIVLCHPRFAYAAVPLAVAGAFGLIAGRYHYLTDTFGGAAVGAAVTLLLSLGVTALFSRVPWTARSAGRSPAGTSSGTHRPASRR